MILLIIAIYIVGGAIFGYIMGDHVHKHGVRGGTYVRPKMLHRGNRRYAIIHGFTWGLMWPAGVLLFAVLWVCYGISEWIQEGDR